MCRGPETAPCMDTGHYVMPSPATTATPSWIRMAAHCAPCPVITPGDRPSGHHPHHGDTSSRCGDLPETGAYTWERTLRANTHQPRHSQSFAKVQDEATSASCARSSHSQTLAGWAPRGGNRVDHQLSLGRDQRTRPTPRPWLLLPQDLPRARRGHFLPGSPDPTGCLTTSAGRATEGLPDPEAGFPETCP